MSVYRTIGPLVSSPEPKAHGELIVYRSIRASVRPCIHKHFQTLISPQPVGQLLPNFMKHHWGGGLIALGFGPGRMGTLVSMATDSSHRFIMGKMLCPL